MLKKEVCGSYKHCMKSTRKYCLQLILLVKEIVNPMYSAQDPLTDNISELFQKKKNKMENNANAAGETHIQTHTTLELRSFMHKFLNVAVGKKVS